MNYEEQVKKYYNKLKGLLSSGEWAVEGMKEWANLEPQYALFSGIITGASKLVNDYKLNNAWKCISLGINEESSINELYNYTNNPERAFYISDIMKKIVLSNSNLSASVIAYILGDIVNKKRDFVQEDAIMFEALSKMTDFDMKNFVYIMDNCIGNDSLGEEYVDFSKMDRNSVMSSQLTLSLCVNVRLFEMDTAVEWEKAINNGRFYKKTYIADKLKEYIDNMKQILKYRVDKKA